jgi:hypothetical protein
MVDLASSVNRKGDLHYAWLWDHASLATGEGPQTIWVELVTD